MIRGMSAVQAGRPLCRVSPPSYLIFLERYPGVRAILVVFLVHQIRGLGNFNNDLAVTPDSQRSAFTAVFLYHRGHHTPQSRDSLLGKGVGFRVY